MHKQTSTVFAGSAFSQQPGSSPVGGVHSGQPGSAGSFAGSAYSRGGSPGLGAPFARRSGAFEEGPPASSRLNGSFSAAPPAGAAGAFAPPAQLGGLGAGVAVSAPAPQQPLPQQQQRQMWEGPGVSSPHHGSQPNGLSGHHHGGGLPPAPFPAVSAPSLATGHFSAPHSEGRFPRNHGTLASPVQQQQQQEQAQGWGYHPAAVPSPGPPPQQLFPPGGGGRGFGSSAPGNRIAQLPRPASQQHQHHQQQQQQFRGVPVGESAGGMQSRPSQPAGSGSGSGTGGPTGTPLSAPLPAATGSVTHGHQLWG